LKKTQFYDIIDSYIDEIHQSGEGVMIPGERELISEQKSKKYGIELPDETILKFNELLLKYKML